MAFSLYAKDGVVDVEDAKGRWYLGDAEVESYECL